MMGLAALVRSHQTVWLTPARGRRARAPRSDCRWIQATTTVRRSTSIAVSCRSGGRWEVLPGLPEITFMHAVLLANSTRILYLGLRAAPGSGAAVGPDHRPLHLAGESADSHRRGRKYLVRRARSAERRAGDDPPPRRIHDRWRRVTADTERRAFLFDPSTNSFSAAAGDITTGRFYPTTSDTWRRHGADAVRRRSTRTRPASVSSRSRSSRRRGGGAWSAPKPYRSTTSITHGPSCCPVGDLFIAGPQKPARRFNPAATPIVDDPARQYNQISLAARRQHGWHRGVAAAQTARYVPRVMICWRHRHTR